MADNGSLINLGELSKPATVLIKRISDAIGGIYKPYQIERIARAEAKAELIRAESEIQITELRRRAIHRFIEEEAQRQSNIESITSGSIPLLKDNSAPQDLEDDWITNFFDKSRIVSDKDMQQLWSRVLAGEANNPGTFSRHTVNLMSDLEKRDAVLFQSICRFGWMIGEVTPLIYESNDEIYNRFGVDFGSLSHLDSLGLIRFDHLMNFARTGLPRHCRVFYYGTAVELTLPEDENNKLSIGHVIFTQAGKELAPICGAEPISDFYDCVHARWVGENLIAVPETERSDRPQVE